MSNDPSSPPDPTHLSSCNPLNRASFRQARSWLRALRKALAGDQELSRQLAAFRGVEEAEALASELLPLAEAARFLQLNLAHILRPRQVRRRGRPWWLSGVVIEEQWRPRGKVLVIGPSNYPLFLAGAPTLQALASGNVVIWKPAPGTRELAQAFADLLHHAGLPQGQLTLTDETVDSVYSTIEAGIDLAIFTGSSEHGRQLLSALAQKLVPAVVELSGCDAVWVRPDADLSLAAKSVAYGLLLNRGRTCIAPRRVFVPKAHEVAFVAHLSTALRTRLQAMPAPPDESWPEAVETAVTSALASGARPIANTGPFAQGQKPPRALVLAGLRPEMALWSMDTFAPVCGIVPYEDEAAALAGDAQCAYRLGATVFGKNTAAARRFAGRLPAPVVSVNEMIVATADPRISFGGAGESGYGETRGAGGLLAMVRRQTIARQTWTFRPHLNPEQANDVGTLRRILRWLHR